MWSYHDLPDDWVMRTVGLWLFEWRRAAGVSQRRLARTAGVSQSLICRIERGERRPSGVPLGRLIVALDWLCGGGERSGPWAAVDRPPPSRAARWGGLQPPAVVGREPPSASPNADPDVLLDALLGISAADPDDPPGRGPPNSRRRG